MLTSTCPAETALTPVGRIELLRKRFAAVRKQPLPSGRRCYGCLVRLISSRRSGLRALFDRTSSSLQPSRALCFGHAALRPRTQQTAPTLIVVRTADQTIVGENPERVPMASTASN